MNATHGRRPRPDLVQHVEKHEAQANRETRRAAWSAVRCDRGRGFLVNRSSGSYYRAPCRSWRECAVCARAYGLALASRWNRVTGLRAVAFLTAAADKGEWRSAENRRAMMEGWRKLRQKLNRRILRGHLVARNGECSVGAGGASSTAPTPSPNTSPNSPTATASSGVTAPLKFMFFKEHASTGGRLHLNILWNIEFVEQDELCVLAESCGLGYVAHVSRIGGQVLRGRAGSSAAVHYSVKQGFRVRAYARKTGSRTAAAGDDWPRRTRRWGASRSASREMGPRFRNVDWYWSAIEPASPPAPPAPSVREFWLLPDEYLPTRKPVEFFRAVLERPPPVQLTWPFQTPWFGIP